jgi:hypothetical protein
MWRVGWPRRSHRPRDCVAGEIASRREEFAERMDSLAELLEPSETIVGRMKARLAPSVIAGSKPWPASWPIA